MKEGHVSEAWIGVRLRGKSEGRNPKAEGRLKSEFRKKSQLPNIGIRPSGRSPLPRQ
jgi:hypothetical protein